MKYAVVLMNLGGPDSLENVRQFLENLFSDPDIFKIPIYQKQIAKIISKVRAPKIIEEYKLIGGKSPIIYWTERQKFLLETKLNEKEHLFDVFIAMRYWHPRSVEVCSKLDSNLYNKIILFPLYPQYSYTTVRSSVNEWHRYYQGDKDKLIYIHDFYRNKNYLRALNEKIDLALDKFKVPDKSKIHFLFSAHGIPINYIKQGDPYQNQIEETVNLVMKMRNFSNEYSLAYQSKIGPMKWLKPSIDFEIKRLSAKGNKYLLVIPISFVSDHVETLFELDIKYRKVAEHAGVQDFIIVEGLNDSTRLIDALSEEIWKTLS
jgi:ferrochelatase